MVSPPGAGSAAAPVIALLFAGRAEAPMVGEFLEATAVHHITDAGSWSSLGLLPIEEFFVLNFVVFYSLAHWLCLYSHLSLSLSNEVFLFVFFSLPFFERTTINQVLMHI